MNTDTDKVIYIQPKKEECRYHGIMYCVTYHVPTRTWHWTFQYKSSVTFDGFAHTFADASKEARVRIDMLVGTSHTA